jgi:hypothetical protein
MMSSAHQKSSSQDNGAPGLIERRRLLDKLNLAVEHKLTLISAPPGYGKTTLANQFMQHCKLPVVWHTIEASQRDVPILHSRALSILEPLAPGIQNLPTAYGNPPVELATQIGEYLREYLPAARPDDLHSGRYPLPRAFPSRRNLAAHAGNAVTTAVPYHYYQPHLARPAADGNDCPA